MNSVIVGIVYHEGTLTVAMRRDMAFGPVVQRPGISDGDALAYIFDAANRHRHSDPMFHLIGDDVPRIIESIRNAGIACNVFDWFAQVNSNFANLGSMQFSGLREQINAGLRTGIADDVLTSELQAFEEVGTGSQIEFARPGKVADALGRYPSRALAILMANQFGAAPAAQYRPLASGYIPTQNSSIGHDPFSTTT